VDGAPDFSWIKLPILLAGDQNIEFSFDPGRPRDFPTITHISLEARSGGELL